MANSDAAGFACINCDRCFDAEALGRRGARYPTVLSFKEKITERDLSEFGLL